jgi:hypothetical protein
MYSQLITENNKQLESVQLMPIHPNSEINYFPTVHGITSSTPASNAS